MRETSAASGALRPAPDEKADRYAPVGPKKPYDAKTYAGEACAADDAPQKRRNFMASTKPGLMDKALRR